MWFIKLHLSHSSFFSSSQSPLPSSVEENKTHTGKYLLGHLLSTSPTVSLRKGEPNSKQHISVHNDGLQAVLMTKLQLLFIATLTFWCPHLKYHPHCRVEMRFFNVSSFV